MICSTEKKIHSCVATYWWTWINQNLHHCYCSVSTAVLGCSEHDDISAVQEEATMNNKETMESARAIFFNKCYENTSNTSDMFGWL